MVKSFLFVIMLTAMLYYVLVIVPELVWLLVEMNELQSKNWWQSDEEPFFTQQPFVSQEPPPPPLLGRLAASPPSLLAAARSSLAKAAGQLVALGGFLRSRSRRVSGPRRSTLCS